MGFVSALPNPSGVETWQAYETNINKVLSKLGVGTVSNMYYGDKVIIEPLFDTCLAGEYQALTVTEIAYCGRSVLGGSSDGGTSKGNSSTWGFIANYTNRIWPNKLYTPNGQGLWTAASAIGSSSKATFDNILTKGYGAGIAYNETSKQVLTVAYDCYGSSVTIDTSKGYKLGTYNRVCSTTERNKTIDGTANVYYQNFTYNDAIGGNGLHDFSTFGLKAPTGYTFSGWKGGNKVFDEKTTTYKPSDFTSDIKNGNTTIWLSAQFSPITYTIKYNGNGNTGGSTASSTHTYDIAKNLTANGFTKTGYTFAGWNTNTSGTGTNYTDKQSVKNLSSTQGATINLYAKWTPVTYKVSYNANGGSGAPSAQTKTHGVDLTLSSTKPTRTGYTFNGWNTNSSGSGTNYSSGGKYTANANVTLYAKWTPVTYTVTYNANGGSGAPSAQTKTYGVDLTLSSTKPTRTGYTFNGWNTKADGSGTNYASGGKYTSNANLTLYAKWTPVTYTVTYNANGGSGAPGNQTKTYGVDLTLSSTKPTRTGYSFNGWNTKSDGSGTNYASGGKYTANANLTLYAKWTPITYTVKYYLDGVEQTALKQTCTYGTSYSYQSLPTKTGYTVTGWWSGSSSSSKGTQYAAGSSFSNLTSTNGGTVNRYAYSTPNTYTVKYYLDGVEQTSLKQNCTYGTSYSYKSLPTKSGYTVSGWWSGSSSSSKGTQYTAGGSFSNLTATNGGTVNRYAYTDATNYTVKYYLDGTEQTSLRQTCTYGASYKYPSLPTKMGYTITGWWSGSSSSSKGTQYTAGNSFSNLSTTNGGVVNRYAYSTPITYQVKFNGNGSTSGTMSNQSFTYDVAQNLTANAFKRAFTVTFNYNGNGTANTTATANATFNGWATSASGSKVYNDKQSVKNL